MKFPGEPPLRRFQLRAARRRKNSVGSDAPATPPASPLKSGGHGSATNVSNPVERKRAADRRDSAQFGENAAAAHLERLGYAVLARNVRLGHDEIDLLALDPDGVTVVIVEVKFRSRGGARPEEQIDHRKRHRLSRAALRLSVQLPFAGSPFRFDAISVIPSPDGPVVEHWPGAFDRQ